MAVTIGSYDAILSEGVGGSGSNSPLPSFTEVLTRGFFDGVTSYVFPPETVVATVFYPIKPEGKTNQHVFKTDKGTWKVVQKSENLWRREYITLLFVVRDTEMGDFMDSLIEYKNTAVVLTVQGIQPFIRSGYEKTVRIAGYGSPSKYADQRYKISVTFALDPDANVYEI